MHREQIAAAMTRVGTQQRWQDGDARPGRKVPAKMMHAVFSAPVIIAGPSRRLTVVDGGKPDEPPVHSADSGESTE